jgi:hypothetical protein
LPYGPLQGQNLYIHDPEDGSSMHLRNVSGIAHIHTVQNPKINKKKYVMTPMQIYTERISSFSQPVHGAFLLPVPFLPSSEQSYQQKESIVSSKKLAFLIGREYPS